MAVALARLVQPGDFVGVGLGTPLALVAALLARQSHDGAVHVLAGGALDVAGDIETWSGGPQATLGKTPGYVPHFDSMDMAERQAMTLQFLRPAQVDATGNLNTSRIGPAHVPAVRFGGGLATADVPNLLPRVIAYHPQHRRRALPERVDWVTGSGGGWSGAHYEAAGTVALVTDLAVITFESGRGKVVSIHPWTTAEEVERNTGYEVGADDDAPATAEPDEGDLAALAELDPKRRRDQEIPDRSARETEVRS
jgi:glutaconate CoA-transferase subunit B